MATIYICKCGRQVRKSTNADNTGNRDTENCKGCPYLLLWGPMEWTGKSFEQNVQGHECRMSPEISYATDYSGNADDKCTLKIHSLDLDFLEEVQAWIDEYADGQLSGRFSRDTIRGTDYCNEGRYSWSISCTQNKKGMAAKAALIERFFGPGKHRLDKTPEEEKAIVLAAIEAGKAKAQERKENMDYIISKHEATGRLYAYYKGAFWFWDSHIQRWLLSQLDDYEVSSDCIEALLQCNPKAAERENPTNAAGTTADSPERSDSASMTEATAANTCAQEGTANENTGAANEDNVPDVCPYLELIENSRKYNCQCSICGDRFVNTEFCNKSFRGCGWYLDQQDKDALNHSEENTDKDNCLCRTCGSKECPGRGCNKECPNGSEGSCFTVTCPGYIERTDIICKDKATNAPSAAAAATLDESAARMCEGSDEETRTTPVAASGAALESLHAQSALPQNAPAQDIAADAPSALGFDFGADESTNAELLQCAQTFVIGKVAQVMAAKRAHDLTANNKNGAFGKWCAAVGISRDKGNQLVNIADNFGNIELEGKPIIEVTPISLLALGAKPSTPDVLTEGIGRGEITTIKQFRELEAQLKAVQTERDEARKAKEKAEQERDAARDAQANLSAMANKFSKQRDAAEQRVEDAERRAQAAEEDAAGWKQAGLEMQELVDQRDERIRELESGITVEAAAVDQEEIERRANELSEPLVKIINQQNAQIERMASGNTVSAQASVLEQYINSMRASLLGNARRAELACYDVGALDSLAQALREFADEIDGLFEEGEENEDQQGEKLDVALARACMNVSDLSRKGIWSVSAD